jgi:hypothetical protein
VGRCGHEGKCEGHSEFPFIVGLKMRILSRARVLPHCFHLPPAPDPSRPWVNVNIIDITIDQHYELGDSNQSRRNNTASNILIQHVERKHVYHGTRDPRGDKTRAYRKRAPLLPAQLRSILEHRIVLQRIIDTVTRLWPDTRGE